MKCADSVIWAIPAAYVVSRSRQALIDLTRGHSGSQTVHKCYRILTSVASSDAHLLVRTLSSGAFKHLSRANLVSITRDSVIGNRSIPGIPLTQNIHNNINFNVNKMKSQNVLLFATVPWSEYYSLL